MRQKNAGVGKIKAEALTEENTIHIKKRETRKITSLENVTLLWYWFCLFTLYFA